MKIAIISDIHFGKLSRTSELSVPGEDIQDENQNGVSLVDNLVDLLKQQSVEYIFVAGDLTSVGSPQEFVFCQKALLKIAQGISIPSDHLIFTLGNHDVNWSISELWEKGTSTDPAVKELGKQKYQKAAASLAEVCLDEIPAKAISVGPAPCSGVRVENNFILFVLNTGWLCSYDASISHGKLDIDQLQWLEGEAEKFANDHRPKIILMHHHPINYQYPCPVHDVSQIEEGSELLEIAGKYGIGLILHGHRHHPTVQTIMKNDWVRPITFLCAGSLSVNSRERNGGEIPNTVHIIDIANAPDEYILFNYSFTGSKGWGPILGYTPETPLEHKMWLGKCFNETEIRSAILKYEKGEHQLRWEELDAPLKFMCAYKLNKMFEDMLTNHIRIGAFPNDYYICEKGDRK